MGLEPHQAVNAVPSSKPGHAAGLVLVNTAHKVGCYAEIECSVPTAGKEIDIKGNYQPAGHFGTARQGRARNP